MKALKFFLIVTWRALAVFAFATGAIAVYENPKPSFSTVLLTWVILFIGAVFWQCGEEATRGL